MKTKSETAAKAVTDENTKITAEINKIRQERGKIAALKTKSDKKLADLIEATDKANFDLAREAAYGTAANRSIGAQAKMNKA